MAYPEVPFERKSAWMYHYSKLWYPVGPVQKVTWYGHYMTYLNPQWKEGGVASGLFVAIDGASCAGVLL